MPVRVALDISPALNQGAGIGRYSGELAKALARMEKGPRLLGVHHGVAHRSAPCGWPHLEIRRIPLPGRLWFMLALVGLVPPGLGRGDFDLFHATDFPAPLLDRPVVLTVHDLTTLLFPRYHTFKHRTYQRLALPAMTARASALIAVSNFTAGGLMRRLGIPGRKIRVTLLGVDHARFGPGSVESARRNLSAGLGIEGPYILTLGTLEPRKNLARLLEAHRLLVAGRPPLLVAGATGWGRTGLEGNMAPGPADGRVRFLGRVPEELLPDLYRGAEAFVFPSLSEGFGLPVLEALACGVPVICSNTSSLPEVAGEAALMVDPLDVCGMSRALDRVLGDKALQRELRARGPERAALFTWERTARETVEAYREVLENRTRKRWF